MLLAAIKRDLISTGFTIAAENELVVFATLDDKSMVRVKEATELSGETEIPVYFYEAG